MQSEGWSDWGSIHLSRKPSHLKLIVSSDQTPFMSILRSLGKVLPPPWGRSGWPSEHTVPWGVREGASSCCVSFVWMSGRLNVRMVIYDWAGGAAAEKTAACPLFSRCATILFGPQIWVKCKLIQAIPDNNYHLTYVYVQWSRREFSETLMCLHCNPIHASPLQSLTKDTVS